MIDLLSTPPVPGLATPRILSVSEVTRSIRVLLEEAIGSVWVVGEICNYRRQSSGHQYFTLKDDGAQLACVLFRSSAAAPGANALLADGAQVQVFGELTVYEARGQHQLVVQYVQPRGQGALQARFEALKQKLQAEGLFDAARKKPLPRFPRAVGIVTSPTGAALRDMLNVLQRRAPWIRLLIHPARVQGRGAAAEIAAAVAAFNEWRNVDVIVLARGGGSLEDLWEFNEERVARAIAASRLPVVSAVGHEIDFSIADFAADLRAPTPSAAAELIAPDGVELRRQVVRFGERLTRRLRDWLEQTRSRFTALEGRPAFSREPLRRVEEGRQRVDALQEELAAALAAALHERRERLERLSEAVSRCQPAAWVEDRRRTLALLAGRLEGGVTRALGNNRERLRHAESLLRILGPQATLDRGYSITADESGRILHSADEVSAGSRIVTSLSRGMLKARIEERY